MPQSKVFDRNTLILELGVAIKAILNQWLVVIVLVVVAMALKIAFKGSSGALGFGLISAGLCACLFAWRTAGIGLPLIPIMAIQHFIVYAMPIFNGNETIIDYSRALVDEAGWQTCVFLVAMAATWYAGMQIMRPSNGLSHTFVAFDRDGIEALRKVGVGLVVGTTLYTVLSFLGITDFIFNVLPNGTWSIAAASISAASIAGFFLVSMMLGTGNASPSLKTTFVVCIAITFGIAITSMLLYTLLGIIAAVSLGFLWSEGRIPWKFLTIMVAIIGFLQVGKADMRVRYHFSGDDDSKINPPPTTLASLPSFYGDWIDISLRNLAFTKDKNGQDTAEPATLKDRIDNLQNLLYVIKAVEVDHVAPLGGSTYWIIPALLAPRMIWPEKPRTHAGQVMLNVYYGRQTEEETYGTYIAWGLLPEAYGNFGPLFGPVFLGFALGVFFSWIENFTAYKPLLSLEGMCALGVLLGLATSFELVASVLITSQFQSTVVTCMACLPFVKKLPNVRGRPPDDDIEEAAS